jgi:hypothetical protein
LIGFPIINNILNSDFAVFVSASPSPSFSRNVKKPTIQRKKYIHLWGKKELMLLDVFELIGRAKTNII